MKKLALALSILVLMCGCGSTAPVALVVVAIAPAVPSSIDQGQTLQFTASVAGDSTNKGVTWSAAGPGCRRARACRYYGSARKQGDNRAITFRNHR